jgi:hypothetical protein
MGGLALLVYAGKDQYASFVPILWFILNVCLSETIGHFFLDFVEEYGHELSLQLPTPSSLLEVSC